MKLILLWMPDASVIVATAVGEEGVVMSIICTPSSTVAATRAYVLPSITTVVIPLASLSVVNVAPSVTVAVDVIDDIPANAGIGKTDAKIIIPKISNEHDFQIEVLFLPSL